MSAVRSINIKRQTKIHCHEHSLFDAIVFLESRVSYTFISNELKGSFGKDKVEVDAPENWNPILHNGAQVFDLTYLSLDEVTHTAEYKGLMPFSERPNLTSENFLIEKLKYFKKYDKECNFERTLYFKETVGKGVIITYYNMYTNEYERYVIKNIKHLLNTIKYNTATNPLEFVINEYTREKHTDAFKYIVRNDSAPFIDKNIEKALNYFKASPYSTKSNILYFNSKAI